MGHPPQDAFHLHGGDDDKPRPDLDRIFKAGAQARQDGQAAHDNPYAAGSEERDEWAAGWGATPDCEPNDEPGSPL